MVSLTPLRDALTTAAMAIGRTEKLLVKAARREATLTQVWEEAAAAQHALREFDHLMAELKAAHDAKHH